MRPITRLFAALFFIFALASCDTPESPEQPAPAPPTEQPQPQPTPPEPPKPPVPQGTDYSKPGSFGRVGVDPPDSDEIATVETDVYFEAGGLMGSSLAEQQYWDTTHKLEECPQDPIYVFGRADEASVPQCRDGKGFAGTCAIAEARAWRRAVNVVRSCEMVPSCQAQVTEAGQLWSCPAIRLYLGQNPDGSMRFGPQYWEKSCWIQYKVTCVSL